MNETDWADIERARDAERYSGMCEAATKQQAEEAAIAADFIKTCRAGDANALAPWAGLVIDHERRKALGIPWASPDMPMRMQALHEVMTNALDYSSGPQMCEAMQLLPNVAHGADLANAPAHARDLLRRMGEAYGRVHSEVQ